MLSRDALLAAYIEQSQRLAAAGVHAASVERDLAAARASLADSAALEKGALQAQVKQLKGTLAEMGVEVARLHMDEQRLKSQVRELEAALKAAQAGHR